MKKNGSKLKFILVGVVVAVIVAQIYISNAQAQQVKFTPLELKDKAGKITDCGFDFIATTPGGYGVQGRALYNPYSHLDMDVTGGKFTLGVMKKLTPHNVWILTGSNAVQGPNPSHLFIYNSGKKVEKLDLPRKSFDKTLVDKMLLTGFTLMFQNKGGEVSIKVDIPGDEQAYKKFKDCHRFLYAQTYNEYRKEHGDVKCLLSPELCAEKKEQSPKQRRVPKKKD